MLIYENNDHFTVCMKNRLQTLWFVATSVIKFDKILRDTLKKKTITVCNVLSNLRDRFVAGLKSSKIKAKILNGAKDSKFDVIVQMAVSSELVDENVRVMGAPRSEIHLVRNNQEATAECLSWHGRGFR
jgi:uncharacterized membrane protein